VAFFGLLWWKWRRACSTISASSSMRTLRGTPRSDRACGCMVVMPCFLYREYQVWMVRQVKVNRSPFSSVNGVLAT
jgi:hypothetical protein